MNTSYFLKLISLLLVVPFVSGETSVNVINFLTSDRVAEKHPYKPHSKRTWTGLTEDGKYNSIANITDGLLVGGRTNIDSQSIELTRDSSYVTSDQVTLNLSGGVQLMKNDVTDASNQFQNNSDALGNVKYRHEDFHVQNDAYQGYADNPATSGSWGFAFTPHVVKSAFLGGGDVASSQVKFEDADKSFYALVNIGAIGFEARAIVKNAGSWYVSGTSTAATGTGKELSFNAADEDWYEYNPSGSLFSDFGTGIAPGSSYSGSLMDNIQAVGVLIEDYDRDTSGGRWQRLESLKVKGIVAAVPELNGVALYVSIASLLFIFSVRRRVVV